MHLRERPSKRPLKGSPGKVEDDGQRVKKESEVMLICKKVESVESIKNPVHSFNFGRDRILFFLYGRPTELRA